MRKETGKRRLVAVGATALLVIVIFSLYSRAVSYRKVIYRMQGMADHPAQVDSLRSRNDRVVGRANYPWYKLEKTPRYKHFWDDYNTLDIYQLNQIDQYNYGY